jgi:hypothetical protein
LFRNVGNQLSIDAVSNHKITETSATMLRKPSSSQVLFPSSSSVDSVRIRGDVNGKACKLNIRDVSVFRHKDGSDSSGYPLRIRDWLMIVMILSVTLDKRTNYLTITATLPNLLVQTAQSFHAVPSDSLTVTLNDDS